MPWKTKDLNLNEIDWAMPRLAPGSRLSVEEVWVESDFTKPPDYLRLALVSFASPLRLPCVSLEFALDLPWIP